MMSCAVGEVIDMLMMSNPTLTEALRQPRKCPSANAQVDTQSSITSISESEFNEDPEDELEVSLEDVYDHLDTGAALDGFVDVNGVLEGAPVAAEDKEGLDDVVPTVRVEDLG